MMPSKLAHYEKALKRSVEQNHYRQLRCVVPLDEAHILCQDRKYLNFSSNDYLGLSKHPYVKKNTIKFVLEWGAGSTASRLITGHLQCHKNLEDKLALLLGYESALLFSSGFQANSTILSCLAGPRSLLFVDRLCHNSIIQGAVSSRGKMYRYAHNQLSHLRRMLEKTQDLTHTTRIIVSESIFSMEGDQADLKGLSDLAEEFNALLYIDDAHAMGVYGKKGMGLCAGRRGIDIVVGTFGKACGSFGAYVACNELLREYLINFCTGLIYSTALPPAILGAIDASLDLIPDMELERKRLSKKSENLRSELKLLGWPCGNSTTQIIPLILGSSEETLRLSEYLADHLIIATAIRPPTVPPGTSRIRFVVNSLHEPEHLSQLTKQLKLWKKDPVCEAL